MPALAGALGPVSFGLTVFGAIPGVYPGPQDAAAHFVRANALVRERVLLKTLVFAVSRLERSDGATLIPLFSHSCG